MQDEIYVDRRTVLRGAVALGLAGATAIAVAPAAAAVGSWGGYANGKIPLAALKVIPWATGRRLRSDAADSLAALDAAFVARFGKHIAVTDAYRTYDEQVALKASKGYLAATPGTSNHGWALAVDLGSGINSSAYSSPEYTWMATTAPSYGWINPDWAKPGPKFQKKEPWHWEYVRGGGATNAAMPPSLAPDPDTNPAPINPEEDTMKPWFMRRNDGAIVIVGPEGARGLTAEQWQVWVNLGYTTQPGMGAMDPGPFQAVLDSLGGLR